MEVLRRPALGDDVAVYPVHLLCRKANGRRDIVCRNTVVEAIQTQIELFERKGKKEFFLRLRQRIGVSRGPATIDPIRDAQIPRELVHLSLVEVCDRLQVCGAVSEFDEES